MAFRKNIIKFITIVKSVVKLILMETQNIDYTKSQNGTELLGFDRKPFKNWNDPFMTYEQNKDMNMKFTYHRGKTAHSTSRNINDTVFEFMGNRNVGDDCEMQKIINYTKNGVGIGNAQLDYFYNIHNPKAIKGTKYFGNCGRKGNGNVGDFISYSKTNPNCIVCVSVTVNIHNYINPKVWDNYASC